MLLQMDVIIAQRIMLHQTALLEWLLNCIWAPNFGLTSFGLKIRIIIYIMTGTDFN